MARFFQPKKKSPAEQKHQKIKIERLDHHGAGIAFLRGKPLFVDGLLPGEEAMVQLTEDKSKFARGRLIKRLSDSEQRIAPFCPHYHQCGGCNMQHLSHQQQLEYKCQSLSQLFSKFAATEVELEAPITGEERGYRRRARISLRLDKKSGQLQFGFRQKQSQQIVSVTDCPVLEPQLNALLSPLAGLLAQLKAKAALGHLELALGDEGPVVLLRYQRSLGDADRELLTGFAAEQALTFYLQSDDTLELVAGSMPSYSEVGARLPFLPTHFIQVNREVNRQMVQRALEWLDVQAGDSVLDLFCGLGNFSLPLAKQARRVVGVEGVQEMVDQARHNAELNQLDNAEFYQADLAGDLSQAAWAEDKFDKVLLDPARAGAAGVVDQLSAFAAKSVVYVSCNPATLARDCQSIFKQGYRLKKLGMLDMFPHTSHLESIALFEK